MSLSQLQMGPNTGLFQQPQQQNGNPSSPTSTPSSLTPNSNEDIKKDDTSEPDSPSESSTSKKAGRRKIKIEFIDDKSRRHITFSKRKAGIMKKAYELSTLTGTQVLLLVASETGHVYTFATAKLQPLITRPEGKNLIQSCLNTPDNPASPTISVPQQTPPQQQNLRSYDPLLMGYPATPESLYNQENSIQDKDLERRQNKEQQKQQLSNQQQQQQQLQQQQQQQQNYIQPNMNGLDMGGLGYSPNSYMGFYQSNVPSRYIQNNSASSSPASPNQFNYPHSIPLNQYGGPC